MAKAPPPFDANFMNAPQLVARFEGERLTIGRSNANDVVLDDVNVSRFHAAVVPSGGLLELRDLDSRCGTRLDGRPIKRAVIKSGSEIGIGAYRLHFDGSSFVGEDQRGALSLEGRDLSVRVDGKAILNRVSLSVEPGEFVAIIGQSGSGKSTLVEALAGVRKPSDGSATLNGEPVTARLTDVGYVPQTEIVHRLLTVEEALRYAARLRLPDDTEPAALRSTVERVLAELSLIKQARTRIASLSGGERKRVSVAAELVNRPSMFFLDEPTTGLDPGLEAQLMELFRALAEPGVRALVVVTHATGSLALCDKLVVIGRGGDLAFCGTPKATLDFFGADAYDDVYAALERRPATEWRERFERERGATKATPTELSNPPPEPGPVGSPRAKQGAARQLGILLERYVKLIARDRRNLLILLGQVPVIAIAIASLFESGLFNLPGGLRDRPGNPERAIQLLFLLVTTAIWFGSITGSREIVKERAIAAREATVGVRVGPYLISKVAVLFALATVQTLALSYFVLAVHPLDEPAMTYLVVLGLLTLTSFAGVGVGLLVSAAVSTEDQATSFIPLTLIPQLLFAGAIVPFAQMSGVVAAISNAVFARWSLAGVGAAIGTNERLAADRRLAEIAGYGTEFFDLLPSQAALILIGFLVLTLTAAAALLAGRRGN